MSEVKIECKATIQLEKQEFETLEINLKTEIDT